MITFRFELSPLDDVSAWRGDDKPTLHWFGLTEGWYWIQVGGHELLRYATIDGPRPYVDYYVARLWKDILDVLPAVLEPVPTDLQPFIRSHAAQWALDPAESFDPFASRDNRTALAQGEAPEDPVDTVAAWQGGHYMDLGYLRNAPRLRFWRVVDGDRDEVTVDWQHDPEGEVVFTAGRSLRMCVPDQRVHRGRPRARPRPDHCDGAPRRHVGTQWRAGRSGRRPSGTAARTPGARPLGQYMDAWGSDARLEAVRQGVEQLLKDTRLRRRPHGSAPWPRRT